MSKKLIDAITEIREDSALAITDELLEHGTDPLVILDACRKAMEEIGRRFQKGVYFVPELIMSGEILKQISEKIKPMVKEKSGKEAAKRGRIVFGTVKGDIHDIGKNLVTFMLDINGFDVLDLGVDASPDKFTDAIASFKPQVVGLSGFLTLAYDSMKETIAAIEKAGQRGSVRIMVGGGSMDEHVKNYVGADAFGKDAIEAVSIASDWIGG
jgi:methanogenic corrinoid protein MtbC1